MGAGEQGGRGERGRGAGETAPCHNLRFPPAPFLPFSLSLLPFSSFFWEVRAWRRGAQDVVGMSLRTTTSCGVLLSTSQSSAKAPEMNVSV